MLGYLRSMFFSRASPPRAGKGDALSGLALFETIVGATHQAALHSAVVGSGVNALNGSHLFRTPLALATFLPQLSECIDTAPQCWRELRLRASSLTCLHSFFDTFGHAEWCIEAFCEDVRQWGHEQAGFLHMHRLAATWTRVARCALRCVDALHPEVMRCLPDVHGHNTPVLRQLLVAVLDGKSPCLNVNGALFVPDLPQRRPAARRMLNVACVVEHQGATLRAMAKDVSTSGLGLEQIKGLVPHKVALVEFADGRCLAGVVVWAKGSAAGLKFDRPLRLDDPLLAAQAS